MIGRGDMLEIKHLTVAVDGKRILHDINLTIKTGETQVLFGPNGSGKTTLLMTIMGFPKYQVTEGSIIFKDKDITCLLYTSPSPRDRTRSRMPSSA